MATPAPSDKIWYLKRIKIFEDLDDTTLQAVATKVVHSQFRRRATIFTAWDPGDRIYLLKSGRVKLYMLSEDGREVTLAIMEPGDIFGETALVNPAARQAFAEALDDATVAVMGLADFKALMRDQPDVALKVTQAIGQRLMQTQRQVESLAFADVSTRLARFLLDQVTQRRDNANGHGPLRLPLALTHQEMANLLGTTRETLTSTLNRLVDAGVLSVESRGTLLVLQPEELRARAHVDAYADD
ncbi:MAG TPA: Crp/Fnr family transcriptional regulator [Chloroflexia bacterium]|nr:Crp/Fnr family transcriptional regulator [Chloroflexia bacterium]